jgi:hypothetical protein
MKYNHIAGMSSADVDKRAEIYWKFLLASCDQNTSQENKFLTFKSNKHNTFLIDVVSCFDSDATVRKFIV